MIKEEGKAQETFRVPVKVKLSQDRENYMFIAPHIEGLTGKKFSLDLTRRIIDVPQNLPVEDLFEIKRGIESGVLIPMYEKDVVKVKDPPKSKSKKDKKKDQE